MASSKVFLSYSHQDTSDVDVLASRLAQYGVEIVRDVSNLRGGREILQWIHDSLAKVDFVVVWWSEQSERSAWVSHEVSRAALEEVESGDTKLIFCRTDECPVPDVVRHKHYIDFRGGLESGLQQLLLAINAMPNERAGGVRSEVRKAVESHLHSLRGEQVEIYRLGVIDIIDTLEQLPRTGKRVRFLRACVDFPVRSVYDHILSCAHTADHFLAMDGVSAEPRKLAAAIAFHDLGEVLLGDIPSHTSKKDYPSKFLENNLGHQGLLSFANVEKPEKLDQASNDFLDLFLSKKHRDIAALRNSVLRGRGQYSDLRNLFLVIDKMDPIIATWRYFDLFREQIGENTERFVAAMGDFFVNPVVPSLTEKLGHPLISKLANRLLDVESIMEFLADRSQSIEQIAGTAELDMTLVESLLFGHMPRYAKDVDDGLNSARNDPVLMPDPPPPQDEAEQRQGELAPSRSRNRARRT